MPITLPLDSATAPPEAHEAAGQKACRTIAKCHCILCLRSTEQASVEVRLGTGPVETCGTFSVKGRMLTIRAGRGGVLSALVVLGSFCVRHGIISPGGH